MKDFIKDLHLKNMDTREVAELIDDYQKDLIEFYVKHGFRVKNANTINDLYLKMMKPKFVKALKLIIKNSEEGLDNGFVVIINGFIEKNYNNEAMPEGLVNDYTKIINKVLKPRIKSISKTVKINEDIIKELLVIVPNKDCVSSEKATGFYSQKMLRKLYILSKDGDVGITDTKTIRNIFKKLFGKKILDLIAINILLEKKEYMKNFNENQITLWNLFTDFALEIIEEQDKGHITELLDYYCDRRKMEANRNRDAARRISFANVDAERYPKLAKRIKKLKDENKESVVKYL